MKKNYAKIIKVPFFLLAIILTITTISVKAQTNVVLLTKPPSPPSYPRMWVKKDTGIERRNWFMTGAPSTGSASKYALLSRNLGFAVTHSITCPVDNLKNFIDTLTNVNIIRFYFAAYNPAHGTVPSGFNNDLTLIIAPCTGSVTITDPGKDRGDYYNITPNGTINKIDQTTAKDWTSHYNDKNGIMGELDKTIDMTNQDNKNNQDKTYSDTKNCDYFLSDFKEFLDIEIAHQKSINVTITGIQIDFCSYTSDGHTECSGNHFKDRLILQFEYTRKSQDGSTNYEVFYIDDQGEGRSPQPPICNRSRTADNALLCPVTCPSPPTP